MKKINTIIIKTISYFPPVGSFSRTFFWVFLKPKMNLCITFPALLFMFILCAYLIASSVKCLYMLFENETHKTLILCRAFIEPNYSACVSEVKRQTAEHTFPH